MLYVKYNMPAHSFYYTQIKCGSVFRRLLKFYQTSNDHINMIPSTFKIQSCHNTPWWALYLIEYVNNNNKCIDISISVPRQYSKYINNTNEIPLFCPICGNNIYDANNTLPITNVDYNLLCGRCNYLSSDINFNNSRFISVPF